MTTALLLRFNTESAWNDWITQADALAGLPDGRGTITLTYPMYHSGKVYCYVTEACPKEVLPQDIYEVSGLIKGEDGIYDVSLKAAPISAIEAFAETAIASIPLDLME